MTRKYIKNCTGDDCEVERRSSRIVSKIIFYILLMGFLGVTAYVLFFSQYLQVTNISVVGAQELDGQEIQQRFESSLEGRFLGLIPKNNFLFVSQKRIENLLIGDYKKIRAVKVFKKFPDTVKIEIDEHKALLVWCAGEKCYLLDENGTAYGEADFNSPELVQNNLLQISDTSGREVKIGEKIIEPSYEQYALGIKDALLGLGFNTTGQYHTPSRMAEEINVKTDHDSELYFSTQFEFDSALRTLSTIMKKEIPEEKKGEIAYIDLRNENKVFYKFKSVEPSPENPEVKLEEEKQ